MIVNADTLSYYCTAHLSMISTFSFSEPEPEAEQKADFNIESNSSYDENTNLISIKINNIGNIASTGYNDKDWRRIFEVTTDIR